MIGQNENTFGTILAVKHTWEDDDWTAFIASVPKITRTLVEIGILFTVLFIFAEKTVANVVVELGTLLANVYICVEGDGLALLANMYIGEGRKPYWLVPT